MGKNYYCDYCDKSFRNVLAIRKSHLRGALHQSNKTEHFGKFRDLKTLLQEETARQPCPRLLKNLECIFGPRCRFSHYMPQELQAMEIRDKQDKEEWASKTAMQLNLHLIKLEHKYHGNQFLPPSMKPWTESSISKSHPEWGLQ